MARWIRRSVRRSAVPATPSTSAACRLTAVRSPSTVVPVPGWRRIQLFPATRRVEIPEGVEVDLGATAKALAADLAAAEAAAAMPGGGVLVSLGGDVAVAGDPPAEGWHIQIAEDSRAPITADGETVAIRPADWRPRARRCAGGAAAAWSCTTSSIQRPGSPPPDRGAR